VQIRSRRPALRNEGGFKGVVDLLDDARGTLVRITAAVLIFSVISYLLSEKILIVILRLLKMQPISYAPQEAILSILKLSLYSGIVLSFPIVAAISLRFLLDKIQPTYMKWIPLFIVISILLFAGGIALCYFLLLPAGIGFLLSFGTDQMEPSLSIGKYVDFCAFLLLATGLAHQAPLISYLLAKARILSPDYFRGKTRYAVLLCFVIAAVVTPTPDVYNMTLMAVPLLFLYFASVLVVRLAWKKESISR
jgi:sec-independent protein translocase protein TatC